MQPFICLTAKAVKRCQFRMASMENNNIDKEGVNFMVCITLFTDKFYSLYSLA